MKIGHLRELGSCAIPIETVPGDLASPQPICEELAANLVIASLKLLPMVSINDDDTQRTAVPSHRRLYRHTEHSLAKGSDPCIPTTFDPRSRVLDRATI